MLAALCRMRVTRHRKSLRQSFRHRHCQLRSAGASPKEFQNTPAVVIGKSSIRRNDRAKFGCIPTRVICPLIGQTCSGCCLLKGNHPHWDITCILMHYRNVTIKMAGFCKLDLGQPLPYPSTSRKLHVLVLFQVISRAAKSRAVV